MGIDAADLAAALGSVEHGVPLRSALFGTDDPVHAAQVVLDGLGSVADRATGIVHAGAGVGLVVALATDGGPGLFVKIHRWRVTVDDHRCDARWRRLWLPSTASAPGSSGCPTSAAPSRSGPAPERGPSPMTCASTSTARRTAPAGSMPPTTTRSAPWARSTTVPRCSTTVPSLPDQAAFVADYERARGRLFTSREHRVVEAAALLTAAYAARCEHSDRVLCWDDSRPDDGGLAARLRDRLDEWGRRSI